MDVENINLTEELILKGSTCNTREELMALVQENGIHITPEQLPELMAEIAKKCSGEISDDALEAGLTAGGKAGYTDKEGRTYKVITLAYKCDKYECKVCGGHIYWFGASSSHIKHKPRCKYYTSSRGWICDTCKHKIHKNGLWLCGK